MPLGVPTKRRALDDAARVFAVVGADEDDEAVAFRVDLDGEPAFREHVGIVDLRRSASESRQRLVALEATSHQLA